MSAERPKLTAFAKAPASLAKARFARRRKLRTTTRTAAEHLGIRLREYDSRIPTLIPHYDEMLEAAAAVVGSVRGRAPRIVDLGIGSGALAARCAAVRPDARIVGIDTDEGMVAVAQRRLGDRLRVAIGDFTTSSLPRCDVVTASFALHHVRTLPAKKALYARCFGALRRGGVLVNADCCLAANARLQDADRKAWVRHLERRYTRSRARGFLRAWADEDVYFKLDEELSVMRAVGLIADVRWRKDCFAVIVATKPD